MSDSAYLKLQHKLSIWNMDRANIFTFILSIIEYMDRTYTYLIHRMSNMSDSIHDSAYGEDYESSGSPVGGVTMHKIQKSSR